MLKKLRRKLRRFLKLHQCVKYRTFSLYAHNTAEEMAGINAILEHHEKLIADLHREIFRLKTFLPKEDNNDKEST